MAKKESKRRNENSDNVVEINIKGSKGRNTRKSGGRRQDKVSQLEHQVRDLKEKSVKELKGLAKELGVETKKALKQDLVCGILKAQTEKAGKTFADGILEITGEGAHGILRHRLLKNTDFDVYVSPSQIRRFSLRQGDLILGQARKPKEGEKYYSLLQILAINGKPPEAKRERTKFNRLTPIFPDNQMLLETDKSTMSTRIIDLLCPIGFGQRAMVVSPPKAGKTILLKDIAKGIGENYPDVHLMVVLIGERPEEVTDIERSVNGEVYASNFDEAPEEQVRVAELSLSRAKRLVEKEKDVVILMDSITRLARAYNVITPASGRTLSGGFDPVAIYPPKRFFGAGRNFEEGPSLTIVATALIETGSKMDAVIFEEFKGTGNMELVLSRKLAEKRIYPAIDVVKSGTRNEELLLDKKALAQAWKIRRLLDELGEGEATAALIDKLKSTKNNEEFIKTVHEAG